MKLNYINKIKSNLVIHSSLKTTAFLEGTYKSIYKGKSMNFENLREYVINDDIKDIDWKASARSNDLYVKEFIAEKKHNVLVVLDSGIKMDAITVSKELKKDIALYTAGTVGYLAVSNGDYVSLSYATKKVEYHKFRNNLVYLEQYLTDYDHNFKKNKDIGLNDVLEDISKQISKRMIIFIITDIEGIDHISDRVLKVLGISNDVLLVNINDGYIYGSNTFDTSTHKYFPTIISKNRTLYKREQELRKKFIEDSKKRLLKYKINMTSIDSKEDINLKIIKLLEEHTYASNH